MFLTYVFLKRLKDSDYYQIVETVNLSVGQSQFLQLENYDLAFRIDKAALKVYENALKNGHIVLVDLNDKDTEVILPEDLQVIDFEEYKKIRKLEIQAQNTLAKEDFSDEDLYYEYMFEEEKKRLLSKVLNSWFPSINMIYIMYVLELIETQTILYSRGYMITEENKEDIFIEIIEKDEDDLIEILERYITAKDEVGPLFNTFAFYRKLRESFDELSYWDFDSYEEAAEELNKLTQKFNQYYIERKHANNKKAFKEIYEKIKNKAKNEETKDEKNKENEKGENE